MIQPTVGRVVWFTPSTLNSDPGFIHINPELPLAAIVAHVWSERMVNLTVFDSNGVSYSRTSVPLLQDDDELHQSGYYCQWMPYQKGQAAKTEALEAKAAPGEIETNIPSLRGLTVG